MEEKKQSKFATAIEPITLYLKNYMLFCKKGEVPINERSFVDYYEIIYKIADDKYEAELYEFHKQVIRSFLRYFEFIENLSIKHLAFLWQNKNISKVISIPNKINLRNTLNENDFLNNNIFYFHFIRF